MCVEYFYTTTNGHCFLAIKIYIEEKSRKVVFKKKSVQSCKKTNKNSVIYKSGEHQNAGYFFLWQSKIAPVWMALHEFREVFNIKQDLQSTYYFKIWNSSKYCVQMYVFELKLFHPEVFVQ